LKFIFIFGFHWKYTK